MVTWKKTDIALTGAQEAFIEAIKRGQEGLDNVRIGFRRANDPIDYLYTIFDFVEIKDTSDILEPLACYQLIGDNNASSKNV